jgi:hypothetical protein
MEVAVINLIRDKSTIPVPNIQAWGDAAENPLGLGPFILMEFIQEGVSSMICSRTLIVALDS